MTTAEVINLIATVAGILGGLGGLGVVVVRWLVRDSIEPVRVEVHALSIDLRVTLASLRERVDAHGERIDDLEGRVAEKVGHAELDQAILTHSRAEHGGA